MDKLEEHSKQCSLFSNSGVKASNCDERLRKVHCRTFILCDVPHGILSSWQERYEERCPQIQRKRCLKPWLPIFQSCVISTILPHCMSMSSSSLPFVLFFHFPVLSLSFRVVQLPCGPAESPGHCLHLLNQIRQLIQVCSFLLRFDMFASDSLSLRITRVPCLLTSLYGPVESKALYRTNWKLSLMVQRAPLVDTCQRLLAPWRGLLLGHAPIPVAIHRRL